MVYPKKLPPKSFRKSTQMVKELGFSLTHKEMSVLQYGYRKKKPENSHFRHHRRRPWPTSVGILPSGGRFAENFPSLPLLSSFSYFLSYVLSSPSSLTILASLKEKRRKQNKKKKKRNGRKERKINKLKKRKEKK